MTFKTFVPKHLRKCSRMALFLTVAVAVSIATVDGITAPTQLALSSASLILGIALLVARPRAIWRAKIKHPQQVAALLPAKAMAVVNIIAFLKELKAHAAYSAAFELHYSGKDILHMLQKHHLLCQQEADALIAEEANRIAVERLPPFLTLKAQSGADKEHLYGPDVRQENSATILQIAPHSNQTAQSTAAN